MKIEEKLTGETNQAFKDFESSLTMLIMAMKERTGLFFQESCEEAAQFARKLESHSLEFAEEVSTYLYTVADDK